MQTNFPCVILSAINATQVVPIKVELIAHELRERCTGIAEVRAGVPLGLITALITTRSYTENFAYLCCSER